MSSGVGYTPRTATSQYMLDNLDTRYYSHQMDLSADPGTSGVAPNEHWFNFADPAVKDAFERRYGPHTATTRHKRWIGPGNEVRAALEDALSWKYGGGTLRPTLREVTDVQATGDRLWYEYLVTVVQTGYSLDHPEHISDPSKPHGPVLDERGRTPKHPFWGVPYYQFNDAEQVIDPPPPPVDDDDDPPVDDPPPIDPPPHVCPPAWARLPAGVLRDAEKIAGWDVLVAGPGKVRGAKSLAARVLAYDAWWRTNHPEQP